VKPGRPVAAIDIDGRELHADESALLRLAVDSLLGCHDTVSMAFWPTSKFAGAQPGAKVKVRLGTKEDGDEDVCAGEVTAVRQAPDAVHIDAIAPTFALSRARKSQTYLSQAVGDIVNDLAGEVEIDAVEADVTLESYAVDTCRSVWAHLRDLAWLAAADLGCAPSGALRFVKIRAGSATRTYRYRNHLLQWQVFTATAAAPPAVAPHGAASEAGKAKWHWILHDPAAATDTATKVIGGFQTRDAADNLSAALDERTKRAATRGSLLVVGDALVRPGAVVEVTDVPDFDPGPLRVLGVRHRFDAAMGFRTSLAVEGGGGGGGLGL
jgi:hypothetical protein